MTDDTAARVVAWVDSLNRQEKMVLGIGLLAGMFAAAVILSPAHPAHTGKNVIPSRTYAVKKKRIKST